MMQPDYLKYANYNIEWVWVCVLQTGTPRVMSILGFMMVTSWWSRSGWNSKSSGVSFFITPSNFSAADDGTPYHVLGSPLKRETKNSFFLMSPKMHQTVLTVQKTCGHWSQAFLAISTTKKYDMTSCSRKLLHSILTKSLCITSVNSWWSNSSGPLYANRKQRTPCPHTAMAPSCQRYRH